MSPSAVNPAAAYLIIDRCLAQNFSLGAAFAESSIARSLGSALTSLYAQGFAADGGLIRTITPVWRIAMAWPLRHFRDFTRKHRFPLRELGLTWVDGKSS
jgi:hypothetical protein